MQNRYESATRQRCSASHFAVEECCASKIRPITAGTKQRAKKYYPNNNKSDMTQCLKQMISMTFITVVAH